jgi:ATP-dependent Lhr-like helicase
VRPSASDSDAASLEHAARCLLRRYGVVCRRALEREQHAPSWRELLACFRTWEARGDIRGGRFVDALGGEQFALDEALPALRRVRRERDGGQWLVVAAADPLNLAGILTPGGRVAAVAGHRILYRGGTPVASVAADGATWLMELSAGERHAAQEALRAAVPRPAVASRQRALRR